jgi:hypothetical protein
MTEAEWLACPDPEAMLRFLEGRVSDRKLRLFACACCRRIWHLLTDPSSRRAVEVSERYADGEVGPRDLAEALALAAPTRATAAYWAASRNPAKTVWEACSAASELAADAATREAHAAAAADQAAWNSVLAAENSARAAEAREQANLLREVVGNPARQPSVAPSLRAWHGGTVPRLGRALYDERRFGDLPVLADALEEAGCTDPDILQHCRQPGGHVRGCWVVDLVLDRS